MNKLIEHLHFQITRNCNLRCEFCGQWGKKGFFKDAMGTDMTFSDWEKIISEIVNTCNPLPKITVWGGEPLVSPVFDELMPTLKDIGFYTEVITNGVLLDKYMDIVKTCVDKLYVSIDGTRKVHDAVRGRGVYDKVGENLCKLSHNNVTVMSVITDKLIKVLPEFLKELESLGISELLLQDMIGLSSSEVSEYKAWLFNDFGICAHDIDSWENNQIEDFSKAIENFDFSGLGYRVIHKKHGTDGVCKSPFLHPHIAWNGNVHYCTDFYDFWAGNVKNETLFEIFNNGKSEKFRQAVLNNKCPACNACSWRNT
ncbi:MAG: radical SAM protein [Clostridia bacterium]|nr:radical SAM protein [Clostridia bacterium]